MAYHFVAFRFWICLKSNWTSTYFYISANTLQHNFTYKLQQWRQCNHRQLHVWMRHATCLGSGISGGNRRVCRSHRYIIATDGAIGFDTCLLIMLVPVIVTCTFCLKWKIFFHIPSRRNVGHIIGEHILMIWVANVNIFGTLDRTCHCIVLMWKSPLTHYAYAFNFTPSSIFLTEDRSFSFTEEGTSFEYFAMIESTKYWPTTLDIWITFMSSSCLAFIVHYSTFWLSSDIFVSELVHFLLI